MNEDWPINPDYWDTTPVDISQAMKISGWMRDWELYWLAKQAKKHKRIVEMGSYCGRSTRALGDNTDGIVYAIDDWKGPRETLYGTPVPTIENPFHVFSFNLRDLIKQGKVVYIISDHEGIRRLDFLGEVPDMVFIDGDHQYQNVFRDIAFWRARVPRGGLLCGHDASWPGVKLALKDLLPEAKVIEHTDIWAYEPQG
jgi:predicted O-methyltransferase YrrM